MQSEIEATIKLLLDRISSNPASSPASSPEGVMKLSQAVLNLANAHKTVR
jgi:hypothetical protein